MMLVVDASVAAMWYLPEAHTPTAMRLVGSDYDLVAPDVLAMEVASAILKALRRKLITSEQADEAIELLLTAPVRLLPSAKHVEPAFTNARRYGGSLYDSVYLDLAHTLQCPVVTNDHSLAQVAKKTGVRGILISAGLPPPR